MLNRTELAKHFAKKGFTKGAEIGVFYGYYSRVLLDNIPNLELLCVDSWNKNNARSRAYDLVLDLAKIYPNMSVVKANSMDAVKDVKDGSLDFVFIDADHHYKPVKEDITEWAKKVRVGGIVSGHDYVESRSGDCQVIKAVDEYVAEHKLKLELTDNDHHNPRRDDRQPCWYFTKK